MAFEVGFPPAGLVSGRFPELDVFSKINSKQIAIQVSLGGGNSTIFILTAKIGEDEPNLTSIFLRWVGSTH